MSLLIYASGIVFLESFSPKNGDTTVSTIVNSTSLPKCLFVYFLFLVWFSRILGDLCNNVRFCKSLNHCINTQFFATIRSNRAIFNVVRDAVLQCKINFSGWLYEPDPTRGCLDQTRRWQDRHRMLHFTTDMAAALSLRQVDRRRLQLLWMYD